MKIFKSLVQGTPEWLEKRKGKLTASNAQAIGNQKAGLKTYVYEVAAEMLSTGEKERFSNGHTDRGHELEPLARDMYELETGNTVETVGFIEHTDYSGCSPDGLVGDDGGTEIKCVNDVSYLKHLLNGVDEIDPSHVWQVQMNLLITERKWWDLIIYNPNFKRSMVVHRILPDPVKQAAIAQGLVMGEEMLKDILAKVNA